MQKIFLMDFKCSLPPDVTHTALLIFGHRAIVGSNHTINCLSIALISFALNNQWQNRIFRNNPAVGTARFHFWVLKYQESPENILHEYFMHYLSTKAFYWMKAAFGPRPQFIVERGEAWSSRRATFRDLFETCLQILSPHQPIDTKHSWSLLVRVIYSL